MAVLLKEFGLNIGHEILGADGISAWQLAVSPNGVRPPWNCPDRPFVSRDRATLIQVVRDPFKAIPSIVYTDFGPESMEYRRRWLYIPREAPAVVQAAISFLGWNTLGEVQEPNCTVRVEDAAVELERFFERPPAKVPGIQNTRPHADIAPEAILGALNGDLREKLKRFCDRHGYDWPGGTP
jgi:hypothetical protein